MQFKKLAVCGALVLAAAMMTQMISAGGAGKSVAQIGAGKVTVFDVTKYGAAADDAADDTAGFQKALDAAKAGKGTVLVPRGTYMFNGTLTVPEGVTLQGTTVHPTGASCTLVVKAGRGSDNGAPFLTLKAGSTLQGVAIRYTIQNATNPYKYPFAVRLSGANITIQDLYAYNAYQLIDAGSVASPNHHIERVYGWTYKTGVYIDKCNGSGLLRDVHLWPFDGSNGKAATLTNATGFLLGYAKDEKLEGCFVIAYKLGYHFKDFGSGAGNYTMEMSGADCGPLGMQVEKVGSLKVNQGQFMQAIEINASNTGAVSLSGCGFWSYDNTQHQVKAQGAGAVTIDSCHFNSWDDKKKGYYCIIGDGAGKLTVTNCDFMAGKNQISLSANVKAADIRGNLLHGGKKIQNSSKGSVTIDQNPEC